MPTKQLHVRLNQSMYMSNHEGKLYTLCIALDITNIQIFFFYCVNNIWRTL